MKSPSPKPSWLGQLNRVDPYEPLPGDRNQRGLSLTPLIGLGVGSWGVSSLGGPLRVSYAVWPVPPATPSDENASQLGRLDACRATQRDTRRPFR